MEFTEILRFYKQIQQDFQIKKDQATKFRGAYCEARNITNMGLNDLGEASFYNRENLKRVTEMIHMTRENKDFLRRFKEAIQEETTHRRFIPMPGNRIHARDNLWGVETTRPGGPTDVVWFDAHGTEVFWDTAARDFPIREGEAVVVPLERNRIFEDGEGNWGVLFRDANGQLITKWYTPDGRPLV
jgi:hypothetical protein